MTELLKEIKIIHAGDSAVFCRISNDIDPGISRRIVAFHKLVSSMKQQGIIESVPSYTGLTVYYNPLIISDLEIKSILSDQYNSITNEVPGSKERMLKIPVCYDKEFSPDISFVAENHNLDIRDVVELHTASTYLVYMIGFTPGFPYMGGLDKRLETPRKKEPRTKIYAGSIGIAGKQTGIYPIDSPGGWQIIGKTPLRLYEQSRTSPFLFKAGDMVSFYQISIREYNSISEELRSGIFNLEIQ